jgi:hypothetical protein
MIHEERERAPSAAAVPSVTRRSIDCPCIGWPCKLIAMLSYTNGVVDQSLVPPTLHAVTFVMVAIKGHCWARRPSGRLHAGRDQATPSILQVRCCRQPLPDSSE